MKKYFAFILWISLLLCTTAIFARQSWRSWVQDLRKEAISQGISPRLFDQIFSNMQPSNTHIHLDRTQPETRLTFYKYRNTRGDAYRIKMGRREFQRHKNLLYQVGRHYGVSPCIITAIWGLESSYGHYTGNFNVIQSLATLSYDGRRSAFFRRELLLALHMVNDGQIAYPDFKGEWAGASGQAQFLPSSWYKYAVDYDGDGYKDIWHTYPDIFASIANYLYKNGWQANQPIAIAVKLPAHFDRNLIDFNIRKPVYQWLQMGVRFEAGQVTPDKNLIAAIIQQYGGPTMMIFQNFRVLLEWNYSFFYAGTVAYVAQQICS